MPVIQSVLIPFQNNKLSGSETFQGDINTNNNRIKNLHTPTSNKDACL